MRKTTILAGGTLALLFALFSLTGCQRQPQAISQDKGFIKQLDFELYLRAAGGKEVRREVEYWPGTRTLKLVHAYLSDGGTLLATYSEKGVVNRLSEWYPPAASTAGGATAPPSNDADAPQLKREIDYDANGAIDHAVFFRPDGTRQAEGHERSDGLFELVDYSDNGVAVSKLQVFTTDGEPMFLRVVQGEPVKTWQGKTRDGKDETVAFNDNGVRISRTITKSNFEDTEFFKEDGRTLKFTVYRHYKISALYVNADGTLDQLRSFDSSSMLVIKYRQGVRITVDPDSSSYQKGEQYRQYYRIQTVDSKESFVLEKVEEIDDAGKVSRRLYFNDQQQLSKVEYVDPDGSLSKAVAIRDNGTIERIDEYQKQPNAPVNIKSTPVDETQALHEHYNQRLAAPLPFTDPRPLVGPPVAQPYYEYGYDF